MFTLIPLLRLRNRRRAHRRDAPDARSRGSFRQLGRTLRELRRYPQTLLFLLAYLVYNDGMQTVIALSAHVRRPRSSSSARRR